MSSGKIPQAPSEHPDQLLWYVSGNIEPGERRRVESHLLVCDDCRALAQRLEPLRMGRSRPEAPAPHPSPEDLDAYRLAGPGEQTPDRARIEAHLKECDACREDLAALRDMVEAEPAASTRLRWGMLAAGIAVLLTAALAWVWIDGRRPVITLMPSLRSAADASVLKGHGPWRATLVPPSEAPVGPYEVRVERPDGSLVASLAPARLAEGKEAMEIDIPVLPGPGAYRIAIRLAGQNGAPSYLYAFKVAPDSENPGD